MSNNKKARTSKKRAADAALDNDDFEKAAERLLVEEARLAKKIERVLDINEKRNRIEEQIENFLIGHVWNDADMRKKMGEGEGVEFSRADLSVVIHGERFYVELTSRKERD